MPIVTIAPDAIVGQYGHVEIRPFETADAGVVGKLIQPLQPGIVVTGRYMAHREDAEPERAQRASWLGVEGGEPVAYATSWVKWDEPGAVGDGAGAAVVGGGAIADDDGAAADCTPTRPMD